MSISTTTPTNIPPYLVINNPTRTSQDASPSLITPTPPTSLPPLPTETIEHIIRLALPPLSIPTYTERYDALLSLSLVNSTWRTLAQKELFRHVYVRRTHVVSTLKSVWRGKVSWAEKVRSLTVILREKGGEGGSKTAEEVYELVEFCSHLRSLRLEFNTYTVYDLARISSAVYTLEDLVLSSLAYRRNTISPTITFPHLKRLALFGAPTPDDIPTLLNNVRLPTLNKLIIASTCTVFDIDPNIEVIPSFTSTLVSVAIIASSAHYITSPIPRILPAVPTSLQNLTLNMYNLDKLDHLLCSSAIVKLRLHRGHGVHRDPVPLLDIARLVDGWKEEEWKSLKVLEISQLDEDQGEELRLDEDETSDVRWDFNELERVCEKRGIEIRFDEDLPSWGFAAFTEDLLAKA